MTTTTPAAPSSTRPGTTTRRTAPPPAVVDAVLAALLNAVRQGELAAFVARHPRMVGWLASRRLGPALDALDDGLPREALLVRATLAWLEVHLAALRPDGQRDLRDIPEDAWIHRTSWRPLLSLACHAGLLKVPDLSSRYHRARDEGVTDNLCGLWAVGTSTFYRYLEKGKQAFADAVQRADPEGDVALAMKTLAATRWPAPGGTTQERHDWHLEQARRAGSRRAARALWHFHAAGDIDGVTATLHRGRSDLASTREVDALLRRIEAGSLNDRQRFDVALATAALHRHRNDEARERASYDRAMRIAGGAGDALLLGIVYERLGWFHESRDRDQALAAFGESVRLLRGLIPPAGEVDLRGEERADRLLAALVGLAWMHVMVNDPMARDLLEEAEKLRDATALPGEAVAMLEQAWSEYHRRASDMERSLAARLRALAIFERLGDLRWLASASNNLSVTYLELGDHDKAIESARRVVTLSGETPVDPYVLASALGNLGIAYFWKGLLDDAIHWYEDGLDQAVRSNLPVVANRARYNLAEAHYKRFAETGDPLDEAAGDTYIGAVVNAKDVERDAMFIEAAPRLKAEILGPTHVLERFIPEEVAAHFPHMPKVLSARRLLALEPTPANRIAAHLELAEAYAAVAAKELAAARELADQHGMSADFVTRTQAIERALHREVDDSRRRAAEWRRRAHGLVPDARIDALLDELARAGSVNKSGYSRLMDVALATASKHLVTLAERGLLVQAGRGPATRYVLAEEE